MFARAPVLPRCRGRRRRWPAARPGAGTQSLTPGPFRRFNQRGRRQPQRWTAPPATSVAARNRRPLAARRAIPRIFHGGFCPVAAYEVSAVLFRLTCSNGGSSRLTTEWRMFSVPGNRAPAPEPHRPVRRQSNGSRSCGGCCQFARPIVWRRFWAWPRPPASVACSPYSLRWGYARRDCHPRASRSLRLPICRSRRPPTGPSWSRPGRSESAAPIWRSSTATTAGTAQPPRLIIGHESLGQVAEAAAGSGFAAGDLVVGIVRRRGHGGVVLAVERARAGDWRGTRTNSWRGYTERGDQGPARLRLGALPHSSRVPGGRRSRPRHPRRAAPTGHRRARPGTTSKRSVAGRVGAREGAHHRCRADRASRRPAVGSAWRRHLVVDVVPEGRKPDAVRGLGARISTWATGRSGRRSGHHHRVQRRAAGAAGGGPTARPPADHVPDRGFRGRGGVHRGPGAR